MMNLKPKDNVVNSWLVNHGVCCHKEWVILCLSVSSPNKHLVNFQATLLLWNSSVFFFLLSSMWIRLWGVIFCFWWLLKNKQPQIQTQCRSLQYYHMTHYINVHMQLNINCISQYIKSYLQQFSPNPNFVWSDVHFNGSWFVWYCSEYKLWSAIWTWGEIVTLSSLLSPPPWAIKGQTGEWRPRREKGKLDPCSDCCTAAGERAIVRQPWAQHIYQLRMEYTRIITNKVSLIKT